MSEQIFLHCRGGKTLWVPSHIPASNEKQPIHMLTHIPPDELVKSFCLFDEPIQVVDNPQLCSFLPHAKTVQDIHQTIHKFRSKCRQDENFMLSRCYDPKSDVRTAAGQPPSPAAPPMPMNVQNYLPASLTSGAPNSNDAGISELIAQYMKQQEQQQQQQGSLSSMSVGKTFPLSSAGTALTAGNGTSNLSNLSSSGLSLAPTPQAPLGIQDLAHMLSGMGEGANTNALGSTINGSYPPVPQNVAGYSNSSPMAPYKGGFDNAGGVHNTKNQMMPTSLQQQQQQQEMMMMMMGMMPSSPMGGMDGRRGAGGLNYPYPSGYPLQNAGGGFGGPGNNLHQNAHNNNSNMMKAAMGMRGNTEDGRYYQNSSRSNNYSRQNGLMAAVGGGNGMLGGNLANGFSAPRYRTGGRMYGQNALQMNIHSASLLKKGILEQRVHEVPEAIEQLMEGVEIPKPVADTYASPSLKLVCATMPNARMTVWLRNSPEIPPEEINENENHEIGRGSSSRQRRSVVNNKEGRNKFVHCNGGIILMLKATFEDVEKCKPVMLFPKQICTHFLVHGYCSRVSCLHEHHSEEQLRQLIAARHVQQKAMSKKERQDMVKDIGSTEKNNLNRFTEERAGRLKENLEHRVEHSDNSGMGSKGVSVIDSASDAVKPLEGQAKKQNLEKENTKKTVLGVIEEDEDDGDDDDSNSMFSSSSDSDNDQESDKKKDRPSKHYKFEDATTEAPVKKKESPPRALSISGSSASANPSSNEGSSLPDENESSEDDEHREEEEAIASPSSKTRKEDSKKEKKKENDNPKKGKASPTDTEVIQNKEKEEKVPSMGGINNEGTELEEEKETKTEETSKTEKIGLQNKDLKEEKDCNSSGEDGDEEEATHEKKMDENKSATKKRGRPPAARRVTTKKSKK